jgi:hypothetical protein
MNVVHYNGNIGEENKAEIVKYIDKIRWLIPAWCRTIFVNVYPSSENASSVADIRVDYTYRTASLNLYSEWFLYKPGHKLNVLMHEFVHLHTNLIFNYTQDRLDEMFSGQDAVPYQEAVHAGLRERNEMVTEDLTNAIYDKLFGTEEDEPTI